LAKREAAASCAELADAAERARAVRAAEHGASAAALQEAEVRLRREREAAAQQHATALEALAAEVNCARVRVVVVFEEEVYRGV
jgi:hypothetical protein